MSRQLGGRLYLSGQAMRLLRLIYPPAWEAIQCRWKRSILRRRIHSPVIENGIPVQNATVSLSVDGTKDERASDDLGVAFFVLDLASPAVADLAIFVGQDQLSRTIELQSAGGLEVVLGSDRDMEFLDEVGQPDVEPEIDEPLDEDPGQEAEEPTIDRANVGQNLPQRESPEAEEVAPAFIQGAAQGIQSAFDWVVPDDALDQDDAPSRIRLSS